MSAEEREDKGAIVVPVGRRAATLRLAPPLGDQVDLVLATALEARHLPGRAVVVCALDDHDEDGLSVVGSVLDRFRLHGAPLPLVAYRPSISDAPQRRNHLVRLAVTWKATVLIPGIENLQLGGIVEAVLEVLMRPGLIGFHFADYDDLLRPLRVGEVFTFACDRIGDDACHVPPTQGDAILRAEAPRALATLWLPETMGLASVNSAFESLEACVRKDANALVGCVATTGDEPRMAVVTLIDVPGEVGR